MKRSRRVLSIDTVIYRGVFNTLAAVTGEPVPFPGC